MHILAINLHINININDLNDEPTKKSVRINASPSALRLPFILLKFLKHFFSRSANSELATIAFRGRHFGMKYFPRNVLNIPALFKMLIKCGDTADKYIRRAQICA